MAIPEIRIADPAFNVSAIIDLMDRAAKAGALLVTFPKLGLSCDDLFHQHFLLDAFLEALAKVLEASVKFPVIAAVGLPLQVDSLIFNCGAVIYRGRLLGLAPKSYLPNYREFYELRQFTPGDVAIRKSIDLLGQHGIPFANRLLFQVEEQPLFTFFVEICEDLWVPVPPSSCAALVNATLLINQ